jgi:hypothetical protein
MWREDTTGKADLGVLVVLGDELLGPVPDGGFGQQMQRAHVLLTDEQELFLQQTLELGLLALLRLLVEVLLLLLHLLLSGVRMHVCVASGQGRLTYDDASGEWDG